MLAADQPKPLESGICTGVSLTVCGSAVMKRKLQSVLEMGEAQAKMNISKL